MCWTTFDIRRTVGRVAKNDIEVYKVMVMKPLEDEELFYSAYRDFTYKKGDLYIRLYNNTEYGIYVEYGHRTRGGKSYIEGAYMLKKTFEKTEEKFTNDLEKLLKKYGFK